jgi:hypothetical protein
VQQEIAVIVPLSSNTFRFTSTFAGIPVEIQYEIEVSEDHTSADVDVIPMVCFIDGNEIEVDLCEDAGLFHPQQLATWLVEAQADYQNLGTVDIDEPDICSSADSEYFAARAEDQFIAQRDHAHYSRAGV